MFKNTRTLFVILLCSAALFSCDPDDDTNPLDELIGTWDITTLSTTNCNDPADNSNGQDVIGCTTS